MMFSSVDNTLPANGVAPSGDSTNLLWDDQLWVLYIFGIGASIWII